jgi:tRNA/tmRNA/rRNA uracil-C5-methylase (TrmA/RlmC/RlmD family)
MKTPKQTKQGVCRTVALPFTLKSTLRQKKNYENSNISPCKNITYKKSSKKRNQNRSRYYNSITNLKLQHKPKISSFKNPHIKIDLLLLPGGQNPLSY